MGRGVCIALLGIGTLSAMDAVAKLVVTGDLHLMQIMAMRSALVVGALLVVFRLRGRTDRLRPRRWRASVLRALSGVLAPICFFASLRYLPLTDATVVAYSSVFVITILSALLLGERVGPWRWSAIAVGYAGVVIALQPSGPDGDSNSAIGYSLVLVASVSYATLAIAGKKLGATESSASLVWVFNATVGVVALGWMPWVFRWPTALEWAGVLAFAGMALIGQLLLTDAYRRLDGSLVAPLEYTSLLWAVSLDLVIWGDRPGVRTLTGALVIIGASLFVVHREARARRPLRTTSEP